MGVTFFEAMSGELVDQTGAARHVAIDIRCDAARATRFVANGNARVTGTIRALPWTDASSCEGTVVVRPLFGRRIEYDLDFADSAGVQYRLRGRKDIRMRHPVRTMTTMTARLERDGVTLASGTMNFHGDDLLHFARSFSVGSTVRPVGRDHVDPGLPVAPISAHEPLSASERATLAALAEVLIEPGELVPPVDAATAAGAEEILPYLPPIATSMYRTGLRALEAASLSRYGKPFQRITPDQRRKLLDLADSLGGSVGRASLFGLGVPIRMAHFSRPEYLNRVGIPDYPAVVPEPEPRWMADVATPEKLDPASRVECDVVVIGTGAGGAPAAAVLAERGLAVVMVEEGRYQRRAQFSGPPEQRLLRYWRDGGMNLTVGNVALAVPIGRMVGGTTAINSGTCFRTPDAVLGEWLDAGFPDDFTPQSYGALLDRVESELEVGESEPKYLGKIADVVAKGAGEMGGVHGPLRRNAPGCDGQGVCVAGCPTGAKRSADVSWVPRALRAGAQLYTGLPATRILMTGRRAVGVLLEGQDRHGAPRKVEIRARAVVVSAGSLLTPLLLRRNGVDLPWLGRNLSIHPAFGALALFPDDQDQPWRAIPQGYYVEGLADDRIRFEGGYAPPQLAAPSLPFRGAELTRWMDQWPRVEQFGFMVRDTGVGSVSTGPHGRPLIRYSLTPRVMQSLRSGSAALAEMLLRGGADEVATRISGVGSVTNVHEARAIAKRKLSARQFHLMGFHPLGTARMGGSPDQAVVDFEHRVYGYDGLYVADGSCVPTSLGVNPQMTIMAMGLHAADVIADRLA